LFSYNYLSRLHNSKSTLFSTKPYESRALPDRDGSTDVYGKILQRFEINKASELPSYKSPITLYQDTTGPVPRPYLTTIMSISQSEDKDDLIVYQSLIEDGLQWYLDTGGRLQNLIVLSPKNLQSFLEEIGCSRMSDTSGLSISLEPDMELFEWNIENLMKYVSKKLESDADNKFALCNILGRLAHATGNYKLAIDQYTQALTVKPQSSAVFRNLGAAYHADSNIQLAFASYQQAISIDPTDALVYLKLAYFYEDLADKEWDQAFENAISCFKYYLENVDTEDTTVLVRLANLQIRGNQPNDALDTYKRALAIDPNLYEAWFNSAHALIKMGAYEQARESLRKALEGDPDSAAAKHMLLALSVDEAVGVKTADPDYIRQLFDDYGEDYDKHTKKLRYAAPRVIRSELAKLYKTKYEDYMMKRTAEDVLYTPPSYLNYMEKKLNILDLGCGTGLVGRWLKDYANTLVGVDISEEMINKATAKVLYTDLKVSSIERYLEEHETSISSAFDVVVAADVFQYIGEIREVLRKSAAVVRPGGYLVFTIETTPALAVSSGDNVSKTVTVPREANSTDWISSLSASNKTEEDQVTVSVMETKESTQDLSVDKMIAAARENGFVLQPNGRFAYMKSYITDFLHSQPELKIISDMGFSPRYEVGKPVPGYLFIIEKLQ